jgi:hypothetical protein
MLSLPQLRKIWLEKALQIWLLRFIVERALDAHSLPKCMMREDFDASTR